MGRRIGLTDTCCFICGDEYEFTFHLFKKCDGIRAIAFASRWGGRIDQWPCSIVFELMSFCFNPPQSIRNGEWDKDQFPTFFLYLFYCMWSICNDRLFEENWSVDTAVNYFENSIIEFIRGLRYQSPLSKNRTKDIWKPPERRWWKVNCDAAFNFGRAATAMVVRDEDGLMVEASSEMAGCTSAFEA